MSVVSLESAKESIPDTWKKNNWWVDRYAWLWWVSITLFGMLFCGYHYSVRLLSAPGEQSNFEYQWIEICNIYKKECVWRLIGSNFVTQSELSNIFWKSRYVPVLTLPLPIGNGLQMEGLKFCKEFILNPSVPDTIVQLTRCKCKKGCKTNSLSYRPVFM